MASDLSIATPKSAQLAERLRRSFPGGDTRTSTFYPPFPLAIVRGEGCRIEDLDGNEYIDLLNNFTALIHGHAFSPVTEALGKQALMGTAFPAPGAQQAELAEAISSRVESVELLRFTNSGSEAVMMALRAARAYTGRDRIIKLHGGYHGSWEQVPMTFGDERSLRGIPRSSRDLVEMVDANDVTSLERAVERSGDALAAIILEPVMGEGVVILEDEFLLAARRMADKTGALLIFDEVITLRLEHGGRQAATPVKPDLTTMGKMIGGGLPVGAFGGRADVIDGFNPSQSGHLEHAGTYNGNAMTMAAGIATLEALDQKELERINTLGSELCSRLDRALTDSPLDGRVLGCGSLLHLHLEPVAQEIRGFSAMNLGSELLRRFHRTGLEEGLFFATRGLMSISTAMDEETLGEIETRFNRVVDRVAAEAA